MNQIDDYQEGLEYSEDVINAVRYGYQYRIEAESHEGNNNLHSCLGDASDILLWIANMVCGGVAYDVIKTYVVRFWDRMMNSKVEIPEDVNKVLIEEDELRRFVKYVEEFNEKNLSTTEKETAYIREEIIADFVGKRASEIYDKYQRFPNHEELMAITREAFEYSNKLLKG